MAKAEEPDARWQGLFVTALDAIMKRAGFPEAEQLLQQAITLPPDLAPTGSRLAMVLEQLAATQLALRRYAEAEANLKRAFELHVAARGPVHGTVARNLQVQVRLFRECGRLRAAAEAEARAARLSPVRAAEDLTGEPNPPTGGCDEPTPTL